jgi:non-ribosomal peptide synthetase component F
MARISRDEPMPLSFAQQRLWFLSQLEGVSATYHIPLALRLRGGLDRAALRRALDAVFARHEGLRSVFVAVDGQPQVRLLPETTGLPLIEHDLRGREDASLELARLSKEEARAPFDLAQGPLIRGRLVQLAEDDHVLLLTQHHVVSDGWSIGVLSRELSTLYQAFRQGQANPLPPLTIQYPDYAAWQRGWLSGELLERQIGYWREALAGAPAVLELPTDRPRPAQPHHNGAQVPIVLDAELTRELKQLSQRHGTTLFMTVLAAWAVVLSRLSGQAEVVIGTPVANRRRAETEGLIGFFVNTLALRIQLGESPSMSELLSRVRRVALAAQDHQDLPFEQVVEIVQPPRRLNHTPIFQVLFNWRNNEVSLPDFTGVQVSLPLTAYEVLKFDLELSLSELNEQMVGKLSYATALFDETTIERHVGYLQALLRAMAGLALKGNEKSGNKEIVDESASKHSVGSPGRAAS